MDSGRIAVIPIDICGAMTLKNLYRPKAALVFTEREKAGIFRDLLHRDIPDEDKVSRMLSIDFEMRNLEFCDFAVQYESGTAACAETILRELALL